ncbi:MAG: hypothetical protein KGZ49_13265 [Syntrophaceae bacterium]|nr:hypothetical protein [Syntrophaceae bacterium]
MKLRLKIQKKSDKDLLYPNCIKAKLNAGLHDTEEIAAEYRALVKSKPDTRRKI